jgi:putative endonuclease
MLIVRATTHGVEFCNRKVPSMAAHSYFVYMVACADGTFYTGFTTDIEKRMRAHNYTKAGAKYTRSRRPVSLVYVEPCPSLSHARKREYVIKHLSKAAKSMMLVAA